MTNVVIGILGKLVHKQKLFSWLGSPSKEICLSAYIYIKSKGIYQPENLMSNGSSRHDDAAQAK